MKIDFKAFIVDELEIILNSISIRTYQKYMDAFRKRQSEISELDNKNYFLLFGLLAEISSMWLDADGDEPLRPLFVFGGTPTATPQNIKDEYIDMLVTMLPDIQDAELQARIADILWLRKRDHRSGKQAIKSYLNSARKLQNTENWIVTSLERVERCIQLARQLNDQTGLQNAVKYLEELLEESKKSLKTNLYVPLNLLNLLQKQKLCKEHALDFAVLSEEGAISAEQEQNWHISQQYWATAANWHQIGGNIEQSQRALINAAECDVQQARKAAEETQPRYLAAHRFLEEAITALRRLGGQQSRIDQLHKLLIQYGQESLNQMEHFSFSVDTADIAQKAQKAIAGQTFQDALVVWIHLTQLPKVDVLRNEAKKNISQNPLRFLVSARTINDLGKTVTRQIGGDLESDETVRDEMVRLASLYQEGAVGSIIGPALYQINIEHNVRVEDLLLLLKNNPFIPVGHEEIYAKGLVAGLRDDGLVSAHLLLPQLENSLRQILVLYGKITSTLNNDLIQDEYPLSTFLYWPELVTILGADVVFNLRVLLVERYGFNLRNLVAHGLMDHGKFSFLQSKLT